MKQANLETNNSGCKSRTLSLNSSSSIFLLTCTFIKHNTKSFRITFGPTVCLVFISRSYFILAEIGRALNCMLERKTESHGSIFRPIGAGFVCLFRFHILYSHLHIWMHNWYSFSIFFLLCASIFAKSLPTLVSQYVHIYPSICFTVCVTRKMLRHTEMHYTSI